LRDDADRAKCHGAAFNGKILRGVPVRGPCLQELGGPPDGRVADRRGQSEPRRRGGDRRPDGGRTGCGDWRRFRQRGGRCRNRSGFRSHRRHRGGIRAGLLNRLAGPTAIRQRLSAMHVCKGEPDSRRLACLADAGFDTASATATGILFGISLRTTTGLLFRGSISAPFGCISPFIGSSPIVH